VRKVVVTLVVLAALVGVAAVADAVLRRQAEERVAAEVQQAIPGVAEPPDVTIEGYPFVPQVLAGRLESVRLSAPEATVEGLRLEDVVVRVRGVAAQPPYVAETAEMTALARPADVAAVLGLEGMELAARDGELVARAEVLGLPLDALLAVRAEGRDVLIDVTAFELGGFRVESTDLPAAITGQLQDLRFAIPGLPAEMVLTGAEVTDDGVRLAAGGTNLDLGAAR
jgi:hypothetical protein